MRSLFSPKIRQRMSKMVACAVLINLNIGWTQILANELTEDETTTRAARIDVPVKPVVAKPAAAGQQVKPVQQKPNATVQQAKPNAVNAQGKPSHPPVAPLLLNGQSVFCSPVFAELVHKLTEFVCNFFLTPGQCGQLTSSVDQGLSKVCSLDLLALLQKFENGILSSKFDPLIGSPTPFPDQCSRSARLEEGDEDRTIFEFLNEILLRVCQLRSSGGRIDESSVGEVVRDLFKEFVGKPRPFPGKFRSCSSSSSDCSSSSDSDCKNVMDFLEALLEKVCCLERSCGCATEIDRAVDVIVSKVNDSTKTICNKLGEPASFPAECNEGSQKRNAFDFLREILRKVCAIDGDDKKLQEFINSKIDSVVGLKTNFPSDCKGADVVKVKTLFEFLKETLKRLCALESQSECCSKLECLIGKSLPFPAECGSSSSSSCDSDSSSSDCDPCSSSSSSDCESSSESCLPCLSSSSSDCGCPDKSVDVTRSFKPCKPCNKPCKPCKPCHKPCDSSSDCDSDSSSDCHVCSSSSSDCDCSSSSSSDCDICDDSDSDCSDSSSSCRATTRGCSSDSESSCSSSDSDSGCSSECNDGRNVFEFLQEILRRICDLHIEVDCATEKEVRNIVCSKFDSIVGNKTCFPSECGSTCDIQTAKTLFQFLKEILKRLCTLDCATEEQVLQIVCSKVDKAVATILNKLSALDVDCATEEDLDNAVRTLSTKISNLQATICSKVSNLASAEDLEDLEATLLSKIDEIDADVDLSCVLAKLSDLHRCLVDEEDSCDSDSICLKNRVRGIQRKVCSILSKVCAIQCRVNEIPTSCCDSITCNDDLASELDECCFTLNSKLDVIDANLESCCSRLDTNLENCCFTVISRIDDIDADIETCCSRIDANLANCCFTILSRIDVIAAPCSPTPIFGPTTITASGTFCLSVDIVGASPAILIDASDIVLDLNGHRISNAGAVDVVGIRVAFGRGNIVVRNGSITQGPVNVGVGTGVDLSASSNGIVLENLFIKNWNTGVLGTDVNKVEVRNCQICTNLANGISLTGASNVNVENSLVTNNATNGMLVTGVGPLSSSRINVSNSEFNVNGTGLYINGGVGGASPTQGVYVTNTIFDQNTANGVLIEDSHCIHIVGCSAKANNPTPISVDGFRIASTTLTPVSDVLIKDSFACDYENGFNIVNVDGLCINGSTAKGNASNGFTVTGASSTGVLQNNTAVNNQNLAGTAAGFFYGGAGHVVFYNNVACENDVNYVGVFDSQVTSAQNARGGNNIDCSLDTPDVVESKLDQCCFTLESKLDVLTDIDITVTVECDFAPVLTAIDLCCFTLESKVDLVQVTLENCCFTLDSKVDLVEVTLENCCFTLDSKVDDLTINLAECCFTLNSKVDDIDLDLENCCFTLNSKIGDLCDQVDPALVDTIIDVNTTCTFSVVQWLKAIYQKVQ